MKNTAKQIEKLINSTISNSANQLGTNYFGSSPTPLVAPAGKPEQIVRVQEKVQPSRLEGGGIKSPLTEDGAKREYYPPRTFTDSSRLILYTVKPIKKMTFKTADSVPKDVVFIFAEPIN